MSLFGPFRRLLPFRRRRLALPPPEPAPTLAPLEDARVIALSDESAAIADELGIPDPPGQSAAADVASPAPPPRRRAPPEPAQRARYFGAAYAATGPAPAVAPSGPWHAPEAPSFQGRAPPLRGLATSPGGVGPEPRGTDRVEAVEPIRFSAFLVWPEDAPEAPAEAAALWRTQPGLLAQATALRDAVLAHAARGGTPLRPLPLFDMAMRETGHAATSLLLCHLVTRAFARGGQAVAWRCVDRRRGTFSDGRTLHRPAPRAAMDDPAAAAFYALFAASALGVEDPGDWYRFFGLACAALVAASGGCLPPRGIGEGEALRFAEAVDRAATAISETVAGDDAAARAWRWANALAFTEFAVWGRSDARAREAGRVGVGAAVFGMRMAGAAADAEWGWATPRAGAWRTGSDAPAPVEGWLSSADGLAA